MLSEQKGDVITILKMDDPDWLHGRLRLKEGNLPRNYVDVVLEK